MAKRSEKWHRNKRAFDEVYGDPYGFPEPIQGHYATLKSRSTISVAGADKKSPSPVNQARPSAVDFFCDADSVLEDAMRTIGPEGLDRFISTYITEDGTNTFNQRERAKIEQLVGNILVERKIYPLTKYFTVIK